VAILAIGIGGMGAIKPERTWGEDSDRAGTKQTTTNEEHGTQKITVSADWQTTCRLLY